MISVLFLCPMGVRNAHDAATATPPIREMLSTGLPVGGGTDGTRVASYHPWTCLWWLVTGKSVGGTVMSGPQDRLDRHQALQLWTSGSAWFSGEEERKGRIAPEMLADLATGEQHCPISPAAFSLDRFAAGEATMTELTTFEQKSAYAVGTDIANSIGRYPVSFDNDGLLAGLDDPRFEVRYHCGAALARISDHEPETRLSRRRIPRASDRRRLPRPARCWGPRRSS